MTTIEGHLLSLAFEPGVKQIGLTILQEDGIQTGRYMRPPENQSVHVLTNGMQCESTADLVKFVMDAPLSIRTIPYTGIAVKLTIAAPMVEHDEIAFISSAEFTWAGK